MRSAPGSQPWPSRLRASGGIALLGACSGGDDSCGLTVARWRARDALALRAWLVVSFEYERKSAVGPGAGRDHCVYETGGEGILPFLTWLRERIAARDTYWLASSPLLVDAAPGIDPLCYALELLPRLPLSSPAGAHWVIYTGAFTPALKARIAAHDPSVQVFSPGYALVHVGGR